MDYSERLQGIFDEPRLSDAQIAALRNQNAEGQLLAGSSVGGGTVSNMGRQMMSDSSKQLYDGNSEFDRLVKMMTLQQGADTAAANRDWRYQQYQDKLDQRVLDQSQKLNKVWTDSGFNEIQGALDSINTSLMPYKDQFEKGDYDIEGQGKFSWKPDWYLSDKAARVKSAVQQLVDIVLKERSGAAVTSQEAQRLATELAQGNMSEELMLEKFNQLQRELNKSMMQTLNSFDPRVQQQVFGEEGWKFRGDVFTKPLSPEEQRAAIKAEFERRQSNKGTQ